MERLKFAAIILASACISIGAAAQDKSSGWEKHGANPVFGGPELGTCFDVNVIGHGKAKYNMYFSWRPKKAIALTTSEDGIVWSNPEIVLECNEGSGWEDKINRSCTLFWKGRYHMWYVGQARGYSKIGYAVSDDGVHFKRVRKDPVMIPEYNYEGFSVMNPYVIRDEKRGVFRISNPLISPSPGEWDGDACYKPSVFRDEENGRWMLWYNGRNGRNEYVGHAIHKGLELE